MGTGSSAGRGKLRHEGSCATHGVGTRPPARHQGAPRRWQGQRTARGVNPSRRDLGRVELGAQHRQKSLEKSLGNFAARSGPRPPTSASTKPPRAPTALACPRPRPHLGQQRLRPGPPRAPGFVWEEAAAAAGLGPLAGYCRRIYCIAARAGCSPAHNRLAVAQGSTLRGKEGGTHSDADCRAFAAVYCRIRPPGPPPPRSQLCQERGRRGPTRPPPTSPPPPNPMHPRHIPTGCPRCPCPSPVPSEGVCVGSGGAAVPQVPPMCCWGRRAPPLLGATAQSWCRAGAGGCKQH